MVYLNRIYTKTGDNGTTALGDGSRVPKSDQLISAIATVDETNSQIGVVLSYSNFIDPDVVEVLEQVQNDLFDVGADLCVPNKPDANTDALRIKEEYITYLETKIDLFNFPLDPLTSFVLPTGSFAAAQLHVSRTVARRAEREVWKAIESSLEVNPLTARYLNRLSDLLFVIARYVNRQNGDSLWVPGKRK